MKIKVEYNEGFSTETMTAYGIQHSEAGNLIGVSPDTNYELTYNTDNILGFSAIGIFHPQFPRARDVSVEALLDVVKITVLETTGTFLGLGGGK